MSVHAFLRWVLARPAEKFGTVPRISAIMDESDIPAPYEKKAKEAVASSPLSLQGRSSAPYD